jgi:hypothetical protein
MKTIGNSEVSHFPALAWSRSLTKWCVVRRLFAAEL